jgi:hypothetical protein
MAGGRAAWQRDGIGRGVRLALLTGSELYETFFAADRPAPVP